MEPSLNCRENLSRALMLLVLLCLALPTFAAGTGLTGEYFTSSGFTGTRTTRIDPTVDFDWGGGAPGFGGLGTNNFSVRWSGQIEAPASGLFTFHVTADDGATLWIDERLVVARTFSANPAVMTAQVRLTAGERVAIRLEFIERSGGARVRLEWSSPTVAREVVPQSQLYPAAMVYERGSILREHWTNLAGTAISTLTASTNYPNQPDGREFFLRFECLQTNWAENYGTRVSGFVIPDSDGNHTFAVAAADRAELWLSTDTNPANRQLIATVTNAVPFRSWTNQTNQISVPLALVGGQKYFVELLHKAGTGNDHWSVAWQRPGVTNFAVISAASLVPAGLDRAFPAQTNLLNTLTRGHPRLFVTEERFEWLSRQVATNPTSQPAVWYSSLYRSATNLFNADPVSYSLDQRGVLLGDVRIMLARIYQLSIAWRVSGDTNFPERAWMEITNAGALTNWNPTHFLDVAEMCHAWGVAYDWMFDYWSATQRTYIRTNLEVKGLRAGLTQYTNNIWWSQSTANNWNLVCNGGLSMAALALGADSETMAEEVLFRAARSLAPMLRHWSADNGNWYEGPGYWDFSADYYHRHLAALESALGSDFGLSKTNGLSEAGLFPIILGSAANRVFNYYDVGGTATPNGPQMFYWARRYFRPEFSAYQRQRGSADALSALWWDSRGNNAGASGYQPDHFFQGATATTPYNPQHVGVLRSAWNDPRETWLAFKGGEMGASHGNLDAGTFVLEALGRRWAWDLGSDNYALPGYFTDNTTSATNRWDYYRNRAEGQNTVVINPGSGPDTKLDIMSPMILFQSETNGGRSLSILDLTPVQSNSVTRAWRGFQLFNGRHDVLVQDEITAASPATAWWFMHVQDSTTGVTIAPDGTSAMLTQSGDRLWVKILSGGGTLALSNAVPLPTSPNPTGQNANSSYAKLAIRLTGVTNSTLAVWMKPLEAGEPIPGSNAYPAIVPLATWSTAGNELPFAGTGNTAGNEDGFIDIDLRGYVADAETSLAGLRFTVFGGSNGVVTLLPDGYTARFTPATNYYGPATFAFSVTDQAPDARLLLHYDYELPDSGSSNAIPDRSGNGRDGALETFGSDTFAYSNATPAALGSASVRALGLFEDGTNNIARVTRLISSNEFNFNTANWTFATWAKRNATTNDDFIFHLGGGAGFGPDNSLSLYYPSGANSLSLRHYINTNTTDVSTLLTGFPTNQWRHLALVRADTNFTLFVDGTAVFTTNNFNFAMNHTQPLKLGGTASTNFQNQRYLNGWLDDTAVFTAALAPAEIAALASGQPVSTLGGGSASNTFAVTVRPVNDDPLAGGTTNGAPQGLFNDIDLRTLASDIETAPGSLRFRVTNAVNGSVTLLGDGYTARFTPSASFTGTASFSYVATDVGEIPPIFLRYSFEPPDVTTDFLATDNSGNNRNGLLTNFGVGTYAFTNDSPAALAPQNTALSLFQSSSNGAARLLRRIATNEFNPNNSSWTFSGWFNRANTTDEDYIFYLGTANGAGPEDEFHLQGQSGQPNLRLLHYPGVATADIDMNLPGVASADVWRHVAVVFNRTNTNTGNLSVYVNGTRLATTNGFLLGMPQPMNAVFGGHSTLGAGSVANRYFNGALDELMLFTNALSADDISLLAAGPGSQFAARSATNTVALTFTNSPPFLVAISNRTIAVGQTLAVTNSANDLQAPPQLLTYSLVNAPTNAGITTNTGVFTWRAPVASANSTNLIMIKVADNGSPVLASTQSFVVTVLPFGTPSVVPTTLSASQVQLSVSGDQGPDYTVQASTNLSTWTNLFTTNVPALPFLWIDTNMTDFQKRFYRAVPTP